MSMEELESVPGTGEGGRVTKKDLLNYVAAKKEGPRKGTSKTQPHRLRSRSKAQLRRALGAGGLWPGPWTRRSSGRSIRRRTTRSCR